MKNEDLLIWIQALNNISAGVRGYTETEDQYLQRCHFLEHFRINQSEMELGLDGFSLRVIEGDCRQLLSGVRFMFKKDFVLDAALVAQIAYESLWVLLGSDHRLIRHSKFLVEHIERSHAKKNNEPRDVERTITGFNVPVFDQIRLTFGKLEIWKTPDNEPIQLLVNKFINEQVLPVIAVSKGFWGSYYLNEIRLCTRPLRNFIADTHMDQDRQGRTSLLANYSFWTKICTVMVFADGMQILMMKHPFSKIFKGWHPEHWRLIAAVDMFSSQNLYKFTAWALSGQAALPELS